MKLSTQFLLVFLFVFVTFSSFFVGQFFGLLLDYNNQGGLPFAIDSNSMHHDYYFDRWWATQEKLYEPYNISKEQFEAFPFKNGLNKYDLVLAHANKNPKIGDVIIFEDSMWGRIDHRVVRIYEENGTTYYATKGDRNIATFNGENKIEKKNILGVVASRVRFAGGLTVILKQQENNSTHT